MMADDPKKEAESDTEARDEVQAADQSLPSPGPLPSCDSLNRQLMLN
jgi:hypothetical protein